MNNADIRKEIDKNNKDIELYLTPNHFILNNEVSKLLMRNEELRKQCKHKFEHGYCIYCDTRED